MWLLGSNEPVLVFSDHANLRYFMTAQNLTARQARWASFLSKFYFDILHISGKLNPADPASRRSNYAEGEQITDKVVLLGCREDLLQRPAGMSMNVIRIKNADIRGRLDPSTLFMPADPDTIKLFQTLYDSDDTLKNRHPSFLTFHNQLWWWRDRLYVPPSIRDFIMEQYHETPSSGHWGTMKTLDTLSRTFGWPNMRSDLLLFIKSCCSCQLVKVDRRRPQGLLKPLPIPDRPWSHIGVN